MHSQCENRFNALKIPYNRRKVIAISTSGMMYYEIHKYFYELDMACNGRNVDVEVTSMGHANESGFEIHDWSRGVTSFEKLNKIIVRIKHMLCSYPNIYCELTFTQCHPDSYQYINLSNSNLHVKHVTCDANKIVWNTFDRDTNGNFHSVHSQLMTLDLMEHNVLFSLFSTH